MARTTDSSPYPEQWSNAKLIRELRSRISLENFGGHLPAGYVGQGFPDRQDRDRDTIRESVRLYHQQTLHILDVVQKRFVKVPK